MRLTKFLVISILAISSLFVAQNVFAQTNAQYEKTIQDLKTQLVNSTQVINELVDRVKADQAEIDKLRGDLVASNKIVADKKYNILSFGLTYPAGAQIAYHMQIPRIPFGLYGDGGFVMNGTVPKFYAGVGIDLRF